MSHGHSSSATVLGAAECQTEERHMLWNWRTDNACFLSGSWHIKNNAMFAASCVGVALLVVTLEFLRRVSTDFDQYLQRQFRRRAQLYQSSITDLGSDSKESACCVGQGNRQITFRATSIQQLIRAGLHGVTIGIAYLLMLIIMSFNGWIFISVVLGAILGKFL
ncbi:Ctr copper transporter-like protein 3 [Elsinoe fawcettii]|nr:Ctr copper transporter-like protein 3 [Elsinoe fawcettii]